MFKENLSLLAFILPALIITYYASNMLDERHEEIMLLKIEHKNTFNLKFIFNINILIYQFNLYT